jgi:hypothetical protein
MDLASISQSLVLPVGKGCIEEQRLRESKPHIVL